MRLLKSNSPRGKLSVEDLVACLKWFVPLAMLTAGVWIIYWVDPVHVSENTPVGFAALTLIVTSTRLFQRAYNDYSNDSKD